MSLKRTPEPSESSRSCGGLALEPRPFRPVRLGPRLDGQARHARADTNHPLTHRLGQFDHFPSGAWASSAPAAGFSIVAQCRPREGQSAGAGHGSPAAVSRRNATGLPDKLKAGIESLSGIAMDGVRVHYNSSKPARFHALAYTQGTQIHVAPGQARHLPHEAWHAVQQKQGRVRQTARMPGGAASIMTRGWNTKRT